MQDVNHCISKTLVDNNPKHTLFVLEDLSGVRNATERVRTKDRYVSVSWSFYDLEQKLIYKAKQNQSTVIKVDPRCTSQYSVDILREVIEISDYTCFAAKIADISLMMTVLEL